MQAIENSVQVTVVPGPIFSQLLRMKTEEAKPIKAITHGGPNQWGPAHPHPVLSKMAGQSILTPPTVSACRKQQVGSSIRCLEEEEDFSSLGFFFLRFGEFRKSLLNSPSSSES